MAREETQDSLPAMYESEAEQNRVSERDPTKWGAMSAGEEGGIGYASLGSDGSASEANKRVGFAEDAKSSDGERSRSQIPDPLKSQATWISSASEWSDEGRGGCSSPSNPTKSVSIGQKAVKHAMNIVKVVSDESLALREVEMSEKQLREKRQVWEHESIRQCSRLMLASSCSFGTARLIDLTFRASASSSCTLWRMGEPRASGDVAVGLIAECLCWLANGCFSLYALLRPGVIPHFGSLCCLLLFAVVFPLLPLEPTCEEWWRFRQCAANDLSWRNDDASCGPQGLKSMIIVLVAVCLAPHLVQQLRTSLVFVGTLVGAYLIMSLIHLYTAELVLYNARDVFACIVLLGAATGITAYRKFVMMRTQRHMRQLALHNEVATKKLLDVLQDFLPDHVITPMLTSPSEAIAEQVQRASVLFLVISDFDAHLSRRSPVQLLDFLNTLFVRIDRICVDAQVTKIETVGEEYVAAVGEKPEDYDMATREFDLVLSRLLVAALIIFSIQDEQAERNDPDDPLHGVRFRMGVHTGPVVAGVIGQKLPRFRLFGDTINTAARMMQKGVDGELQFGKETQKYMPAWAAYNSRGSVEMKGKGSVDVFLLDRSAADGQDTWEEHRSFAHRKTGRSSLNDIISQTLSGVSGGTLSPRGRRSRGSDNSGNGENGVVITSPTRTLRARTAASLENARRCGAYVWASLEIEMNHLRNSGNDMQHKQWLSEFYKARIASRLRPRTIRQLAVLVLTTAIEAIVAGALEAGHTGKIHGSSRLLFFLLIRLLLIIVLLAWAFAAHNKQRISESPRLAEAGRLVHVCLQTLLQYFAYSLLVRPGVDDINLILSAEAAELEARKETLRLPVWQAAFLLWYAVTVLDLRLRSKPTMVFVALSVLMMLWLPLGVPVVRKLSTSLQVTSVLITGALGVQIAHLDQAQDRNRFEMKEQVARASQRIDMILGMLMPPLVAAHVSNRASRVSSSMGSKMQQHASSYKKATIACSDLVGFTKIASTRTPVEVVDMVSELFARFDDLSDYYLIYKVETVGDAYIAGQALRPLTAIYRPMSVVVFGFEMINVVREWSKEKGVPVDCRVGVHTGECVGGVVGVEMKRYHLFGTMLASLESLESTAPTGQVQFSRSAEAALAMQMSEENLSGQILSYSARTEAQLQTSKGDPVDYEEVGGAPTFVVHDCRPELYDPQPQCPENGEVQLPDQLPDQASVADSPREPFTASARALSLD